MEQPIITCCEAKRGVLWWTEAFYLVKEEWGAWFVIGAGYFAFIFSLAALFSLLVNMFPKAEMLLHLPTILMPCLIVGFIAAGWSQVRGQKPRFNHFFSGFKSDVKTLLSIGLIMMILFMLTGMIGESILGGSYEDMIRDIGEDTDAFLTRLFSPRFLSMTSVVTVLYTLIFFAVWLAPMLVVFQRAKTVGAILGSLKAFLINWRAVTVYMLFLFFLTIVIFIAVALLMLFIALIIGPDLNLAKTGFELVSTLVVILLLPLFTSWAMLTSFVAYCDIFHANDHIFPRLKK
ncbi:MAG: DUF2189 domain-containing protein [Burkholderiales bacterium]|nr:DUF2189 domain-containing protein [Burkholderiales bacterium]